MSPRRIALGLALAVVASASTLGATAARASSTICVALVVDARSIGSDVSTTCATVAKNSTGLDVLTAAGHTVSFRQDGLLCTIDGLPKGGCSGVNDSHYWAYFHRAPGATVWTYSNEGSATYEPANASTEGWVYDDGTALKPDNIPYDKICTTKATSPSPSPSHHAPSTSPSPAHTSATSPAPHHHASGSAGSAAPTPAATGGGSSTTGRTGSPNPTGTPGAGGSGSGAATTASAAAPSSGPTESESPSSGSSSSTGPLLVSNASPPSSGHGVLNGPLGVVVGALIIAAIGGAALARSRSR